MSLAEKQCIPCQVGIPRLSESEAAKMLQDLPEWQLAEQACWLKRHYVFKNWKQAYAFLAHIDQVAEEAGHHPDVEFGWGYCKVSLQTHKIKGLHENDFILAAKIEERFVS